MKQPIKYFVFNKETDFTSGSRYNISLLSPGITIQNPEEKIGFFYSRLLDTKEKQTHWHRLLLEGENVNEASVRIWIYASEEPTILQDGKQIDLSALLGDESISAHKKQRILEPYCVKRVDQPRDVLLHEVKGRYLWLGIRMIAQGAQLPQIRRMKIIFPQNTWLQYLPEVYQKNQKSASFVERYLGIFQSLYQDMTEQIRQAPKYMDMEAVGGPYVRWLASWLSVEDSYIWNEEQLKYLMKHGMELYRKRGTVSYLKEMVKLYTGREPYIVEYDQIEPYLGKAGYGERLIELYGENRYVFTVVIDGETRISNREYQILNRIVERAKPAHMESNVIVLEPFIFLDKHSYLGINSVLGNYGAFVLDGQASIPFTKIVEKEEPM